MKQLIKNEFHDDVVKNNWEFKNFTDEVTKGFAINNKGAKIFYNLYTSEDFKELQEKTNKLSNTIDSLT